MSFSFETNLNSLDPSRQELPIQFQIDKQHFELDWESTWDRLFIEVFQPEMIRGAVLLMVAGLQAENTINYPQEKSIQSPIFRAEHSLRR